LTQTVVRPGEYITIYNRDHEETGDISRERWGLKYPEITFNCPGANQAPVAGPTITGYLFIKHWTPAFECNSTLDRGKQTALVYRLGEAMLIYAEAKAELGTITNDDLDRTVNALRERAGFDFAQHPNARLTLQNIPSDPRLDRLYAEKLDYAVSPILREIRRERRVEMAMEGLRRQDLVRWRAGKLMEVPLRGMKFTPEKQVLYNGSTTFLRVDQNDPDKGFQPGRDRWAPQAILNIDVFIDSDGFIIAYPRTPDIANGTLRWEDRFYFWPIPLDQLTLNKNLTQTPGWLDIVRE